MAAQRLRREVEITKTQLGIAYDALCFPLHLFMRIHCTYFLFFVCVCVCVNISSLSDLNSHV